MPNTILTPALRRYIDMSPEEQAELKGLRRTQYRYRLNTRIAMALEDLDYIIEKMPKVIGTEYLIDLLQRKLRRTHPKENLVIRIEFLRD